MFQSVSDAPSAEHSDGGGHWKGHGWAVERGKGGEVDLDQHDEHVDSDDFDDVEGDSDGHEDEGD